MFTDELHASQNMKYGKATEYLTGETKICPRCGAILFKDMDICYGCLYDFNAALNKTFLATNGYLGDNEQTPTSRESDYTYDAAARSMTNNTQESALSGSADDTIDLSEACLCGSAEIRIISAALEISCEVPIEGITVGRESDNDVILRDRTVSRHHLRILPDTSGVVALNQGATNPANINGVPILESVHVVPGGIIDICGTQLEVVKK